MITVRGKIVLFLLSENQVARGGLEGSKPTEKIGICELTSKVTPEHKIQNKETILIILEGVAQINDIRMVDLVGYSEDEVLGISVTTPPQATAFPV
jgi:hypothetical protein